MVTGPGLLPVRSITRASDQNKFTYMNCDQDFGEGYKILSSLLDDILRGRVADDFGWNVHSVYDSRLEAMSSDMRTDRKPMKNASFICRSDGAHSKDFYFALLPARRYCN